MIDGKAHALEHEQALKEKIVKLKKAPVLVSFLIGDDPASILYTEIKQKKAFDLGIDFRIEKFMRPPQGWTHEYERAVRRMRDLNQDSDVDGVMVQLPVPEKFLGEHQISDLISLIASYKDVDGLSPCSPFMAATVRGIMSLIKDEQINLSDKIVVVVGAKGEVGSRLMGILSGKVKEITGVDKETLNIGEVARRADLLISATGKQHIITEDMVKTGVILFDVGSEKLSSGQVVGDIDPDSYAKASLVTPVPGGVGPMTVISLMENLVEAANLKS